MLQVGSAACASWPGALGHVHARALCVPRMHLCQQGMLQHLAPVRVPAMLAGVKGSHSHVKGGQDPETKSKQAATPQGGARTCNIVEQAATCHV